MKASEQKKIAKMLFVDTGLSQIEIAKRLGKSKTQISRWVKDGEWKTLRSAAVATDEQIVQRTYTQINLIYDEAEKEGRPVSTAESDKIVKLTASIRSLNKGANLASYISVCEEFLKFIRKHDKDLTKTIGDYQMEFLTQKATELSKD